MAKLTPFPWEWRSYSDGGSWLISSKPRLPGSMVRARLGVAVHVDDTINDDQSNISDLHPDALVIAAAPEMLALLQCLVVEAEKATSPSARMYGYEEAKNLIAKASGQYAAGIATGMALAQ